MNVEAEKVHAQREIDRTAAMMQENRKTREALAAAGLPYGPEQYRGFINQALSMVRKLPPVSDSRRQDLQRRMTTLKVGSGESS
jgi:hypothetical protein